MIEDSLIKHNGVGENRKTMPYYGGGVFVDDCNFVMRRCNIVGNESLQGGSGFFGSGNKGDKVTLLDSKFEGNNSNHGSGAVTFGSVGNVTEARLRIMGCTFRGNIASLGRDIRIVTTPNSLIQKKGK